MKVLIVGGGGREHALAWKLGREQPGLEVVAAPGNPGIAELPGARCVAVRADDVEALVALAEAERPDYTLVGPEAPLAAGIVDRFRARGLPIFGPTRAAAEIETSKAWAKQLMLDAGIPTARAERHTDAAAAKRAARAFGAPVVIKASGLAAGKGVIVAQTLDEADRAIDAMLVEGAFGAAGAEVLVEEFMEGEELSIFYLTDGFDAIPLVPAQDHKRLLDGDAGPNTGGMGAYVPVSGANYLRTAFDLDTDAHPTPGSASAALASIVANLIVRPTLAAMRDAGRPFTGLIYAGLMLTREGPKVVEFNCRFGDPETQAVMAALDRGGIGIGMYLSWLARGGRLDKIGMAAFALAAPLVFPDEAREAETFRSMDACAVTTVVAAPGYPDRPRTGDPITLPEQVPEGVYLFHAGTARDAQGRLVTAGGRVLAVTAVAGDFATAQALSRATAEAIHFPGRQLRTDIGWREAARRSALQIPSSSP